MADSDGRYYTHKVGSILAGSDKCCSIQRGKLQPCSQELLHLAYKSQTTAEMSCSDKRNSTQHSSASMSEIHFAYSHPVL
jgi:hypothetical protein